MNIDKDLKKFEKLLKSYAKSRDISRECNGMRRVESALLTLMNKNIDQKYSKNVLVALAGVRGALSIVDFKLHMELSYYHNTRKEWVDQIYISKKRAVEHSARWLVSNSNISRLLFWKRQQNSFTYDSAKELLLRLFEEYFYIESDVISAQNI